MSNIMFFSIPAHGHTNPTIAVVEELVSKGHRVRYYFFEEFKEKIESAEAEYVSCDCYLPSVPKMAAVFWEKVLSDNHQERKGYEQIKIGKTI